jgi:FkbM family methyltransferase
VEITLDPRAATPPATTDLATTDLSTSDLATTDLDGFVCFDNWLSRWVSREALAGATYPRLPIVDDVQVILDVGANCGAASVYFARAYPEATVHAIEPASSAVALLRRNTGAYRNVRVHNIGLYSTDATVPLYSGSIDSVTASILPRASKNDATSELVTLRDAKHWTAEQGIDRIDVLKLDVEGCEVDVLERLGELLPQVQVIYLEYDSRPARRQIDRLVAPSHELCHGVMFLDQGEVIYVARALLEDEAAEAALTDFFRQRIAGAVQPGVPSTPSRSAGA